MSACCAWARVTARGGWLARGAAPFGPPPVPRARRAEIPAASLLTSAAHCLAAPLAHAPCHPKLLLPCNSLCAAATPHKSPLAHGYRKGGGRTAACLAAAMGYMWVFCAASLGCMSLLGRCYRFILPSPMMKGRCAHFWPLRKGIFLSVEGTPGPLTHSSARLPNAMALRYDTFKSFSSIELQGLCELTEAALRSSLQAAQHAQPLEGALLARGCRLARPCLLACAK